MSVLPLWLENRYFCYVTAQIKYTEYFDCKHYLNHESEVSKQRLNKNKK